MFKIFTSKQPESLLFAQVFMYLIAEQSYEISV